MKKYISSVFFWMILFVIAIPNIKADEGYKVVEVEKSNTIVYQITDYERDLSYSWEIDKKYALEFKDNINLRLDIDAKNIAYNSVNKKVSGNKLFINFDYHGDLPTEAIITIDASKKFNNNEKLYLYYYNDMSNEIEFINNNIKVDNNEVTFTIKHCSDYFLTMDAIDSNKNSFESLNIVILGLAVVSVILFAKTINVTTKKDKR